MLVRRIFPALTAGVASLVIAGGAQAHIALLNPPDWLADSAGSIDPAQKHEPCGDAAMAKPTGKVTTYHPGDVIPVMWKEIISHTGWFRIALTPDRAMLKEPIATVDPSSKNATDATTTKPEQMMVNADGVYIVDGLYRHQQGGNKTFSWMFTVPNITCAHCTLQVLQFMADHGTNTGQNDGYFYHHCADLAIEGGVAGDGGTPASDGGSADASGPPTGADSGAGTGGASGGGTGGSTGGATGGTTGTPTGGVSGTGGTVAGGAGGSSAPAPAKHGGCTVGGGGSDSSFAVAALGLALVLGMRRRARRP
jgi:MYXO-CTERM domain-containing protein